MATFDESLYADQLNIETPEQVELRFPVAGVGSRFLAVFLDTLIQVLVYALVILVLYLAAAQAIVTPTEHTSDTADKWIIALFILFNFLLFWGYFSLFEGLWHGQTPGKRLMKLRVIKDSGRQITLFEAMARNLLRVIDYFPGVYVVGLITMLCNRQKKRLGDFAAGTLVVHERVDEQPLLTHVAHAAFPASPYSQPSSAPPRMLPGAQAEWERHQGELPADAVARLGTPELQVVELFFHRALDLSVERRAELGARVAARLSERMRVPMPAGMAPERMLEIVAYRLRAGGTFRG